MRPYETGHVHMTVFHWKIKKIKNNRDAIIKNKNQGTERDTKLIVFILLWFTKRKERKYNKK